MMGFPEDFEIYKQNVTLPMLEVLASDLNRSLKSLQQLGVGFYPAKQSWVFAERDHDGDIIGLSLRTLDGKKFMIEGSKRGLIYAYNENHREGDKRYEPGRCHWVRIQEAGVECPICGKPDWCMVSSDNPSDPSAVLCSRIKEGSRKAIGDSGFLHLLNESRAKNNQAGDTSRTVISTNDLPIIIVEGASDVLAALDIGFTAIGKPSAKGGMAELKAMPLVGKEVWVLGENDAGAGKDGMEKTFVNLQGITDKLLCVMPPEGIKDLRQWVDSGLTQESLFAYMGQHGHSKEEDPNRFPDDTARTIAKRFLEQHEHNGIRTLRRRYGDWFEWDKGRYTKLETDDLRGKVYRFLDGKTYIYETKDDVKPVPYKPTKAKVSDIIDALRAEYPVRGDIPVWIEQRGRPDTRSLISFTNGILDVDRFCQGETRMDKLLLEPTPELFTLARLPYAYDIASWSNVLDSYCETTLNGDADSIRLLAQWLGYNAVHDCDMEQEAFLICLGPTRSGKSTILSVMEEMLGYEQCGVTTMSALANAHGLASLVGKSSVIAGDVKNTLGKKQMDAAIQTLLNIVGNDTVQINEKFKPMYRTKLKCRITMAMNDLPVYSDNSKAMLARTLILSFPNSYLGREDFGLKRKLKAEAKAGKIINFALWGLKDLRETGRFVEPGASMGEKQQLLELTSPVTAFTQECCLMSNDVSIAKDQLYEAYKSWCVNNCRRPGNKIHFGRWLGQDLPTIKSIQKGSGKDREYHYGGVTLTQSAFMKLLEKP